MLFEFVMNKILKNIPSIRHSKNPEIAHSFIKMQEKVGENVNNLMMGEELNA